MATETLFAIYVGAPRPTGRILTSYQLDGERQIRALRLQQLQPGLYAPPLAELPRTMPNSADPPPAVLIGIVSECDAQRAVATFCGHFDAETAWRHYATPEHIAWIDRARTLPRHPWHTEESDTGVCCWEGVDLTEEPLTA